MQADYFPLPEDSELCKALKWQWDHRVSIKILQMLIGHRNQTTTEST